MANTYLLSFLLLAILAHKAAYAAGNATTAAATTATSTVAFVACTQDSNCSAVTKAVCVSKKCACGEGDTRVGDACVPKSSAVSLSIKTFYVLIPVTAASILRKILY